MTTRVHLIKPPSPALPGPHPAWLPLDLLSLAGVVRDEEYRERVVRAYGGQPVLRASADVQIWDWSTWPHAARLPELVAGCGAADIFGISAFSTQAETARRTALLIRQAYPTSTILLGGPHATLYGDADWMASAVDIVNVGEGFENLPLILHDRDVRTARLARRSDAADAAPRLPMDAYPLSADSLDVLSLPGYPPTRLAAYGGRLRSPIASVMAGVGCRGRCAFCAGPVLEPRLRHRSIERVCQEIRGYRAAGVRLFDIADDDFSGVRERPLALARALEEEYPTGDIEWVFNMLPRHERHPGAAEYRRDVSYFDALGRGHCRGFSLGVETGDEQLLRACGKPSTVSDALRLTTLAQHCGLGVRWFLMVGLPGQDWRSIEHTAAVLRQGRPTDVAVSVYAPRRGTRWYGDTRVRVTENGRTETDVMTADEIDEAMRFLAEVALSR
ncbi:MAG: B12-binding domain-containing radical SAM protein [Vicinamibacterales bacterium]|nr:B12-binding domain-containing radical SAM protein [Vicinamibacterales bacterium]